MKIPVKIPVLFIGLSYFFILITPFGWNMFIHLAPFYAVFFLYFIGSKYREDSTRKLITPFLLYTAYTFFSIIFIANLDGTFGKVLRCIYESIVLIALVKYDFNKNDVNFIHKCSIVSCLFIGIKMLIQGDVLSSDANRHIITNFGKEADPNYLAATFIFPVMILFHNILKGKKKKSQFFLIVILLISVVMTGSRGALLSILVGGLIVYLWENHSVKHFFAGIAIMIIALVAYQLLPDYFASRYSIAGISNDNGSNYLRINLWNTCYEIFQSSPILGRGGNSMLNLGTQYGAYMRLMAHSTYLDTLADYGLIGGVLFFGFLLSIIVLSIKRKNGLTLGIMTGTLVCSVFISAEHSAFLWQNLTMCIIMIKLQDKSKFCELVSY